MILAFAQRLAGDTAAAKATAEQARNTLKPLCRDQPDNSFFAQQVALANAALAEKEMALSDAERATTLLPNATDPLSGPTREEVLALIQMMFGDITHSISTLTGYYKHRSLVGFTARCQLRQPFLDLIRSGILCELIPLFKDSVRKRKNNLTSDHADASNSQRKLILS